MGKEGIIELIDKSSLIKSKFQTENITMFSSYGYRTNKRTSGGMDFDMIYKQFI